MSGAGSFSKEEFLYILQNAKVVKSSEEYYRTLFSRDDVYSWNLRDKHMMETLDLLAGYYNSLESRPVSLLNRPLVRTSSCPIKAMGSRLVHSPAFKIVHGRFLLWEGDTNP